MGMYYVIVKDAHNKMRIDYDKCGVLWANRLREAMIEVDEYVKTLNEVPKQWTPKSEPFYVARHIFHGDAVRIYYDNPNWPRFRKQRVTPRPTLLDEKFRVLPTIEHVSIPARGRRQHVQRLQIRSGLQELFPKESQPQKSRKKGRGRS